MKLLIKIYLDDINPYDLTQLIDIINNNITEKTNTKIQIMSNDFDFDFENYDYTCLTKTSIPQMINYKLNYLEWDIILPIIRPCIVTPNFDFIIKKLYKNNFSDLNGVLLLNGVSNNYYVVGREYYNKFGFLYNPAYNKKNYEEEFLDILKINNKSIFIDKVIIKTLILKSDDDKIYELRKKLNFGII